MPDDNASRVYDGPDVSMAMEGHMTAILVELGYDPMDQHFQRTPHRVASVLREFAKNADPSAVSKLLEVVFVEKEAADSLVMVGPIHYVSMCAHHLLAVTGRAWVGYLPDEHVCGLSKLERLVHHFAQQLTVQERVTQQVANALEEHLIPLGCMVVVKAQHGCMAVRGVRNPDSITTTSAVRGVHKESAAARSEFLHLMEGH